MAIDPKVMDELVQKARRYQNILNIKEGNSEYVKYEVAKANFKQAVTACKAAGVTQIELLALIQGSAASDEACKKKINAIYKEAGSENQPASIGRNNALKQFAAITVAFKDAHEALFSRHQNIVDEYHAAKKGAKTGPNMGYLKFLKAHRDELSGHDQEINERLEREAITHPKIARKMVKKLDRP